MDKKNKAIIAIVAVIVAVVIVVDLWYISQDFNGDDFTGDESGLPNPSAVYCEECGGTYEIREDPDGGQYGVCVFPDGSECPGWDFYNGDCQLML